MKFGLFLSVMAITMVVTITFVVAIDQWSRSMVLP